MKAFSKPAGGNTPLAGAPATKLDYTVIMQRLEKLMLSDLFHTTPNRSQIKTIQTGKIIEVHIPERPTIINHFPRTKKKDSQIDRSEEYQIRRLNKSRNTLKMLVEANFDNNSKFVTLTFRNTDEFDINNPEICKTKVRLFIRKLKLIKQDLKFIFITEFQKRGAVHYHLLTDLQYINNEELGLIWGHGFIKINRIDKAKNLGNYVSKYMTKESFDLRLKNIRSYETSRNLVRPVVYQSSEAIKIVKKYKLTQLNPEKMFEYTSEYNGKVIKLRYTLDKKEL